MWGDWLHSFDKNTRTLDDLSLTASSNFKAFCVIVHGCKVIKSCPGYPLTRQLMEAAKIDGYTGMSINDKNDWQRQA